MRRVTPSPSGFVGAVAALVGSLLGVSVVSAQTPDETRTDAGRQVESAETERARAEFRRGAELSRAARWDEARDAFARSYSLRSHPVTTYNLAFCERALGHPALATVLFERALTESSQGASGRLPEPLVGFATDYRDETRARLARLIVHLEGAESLAIDGIPIARVERDGAIVFVAGAGPPAALGAESTVAVWVDPGQRVLVASKPNHGDRVVSRRFHAAERAELGFSWKSIPTPALPVVLPAAPAPQRESRPWAYVALGSGVAGVVASGLAGFAAYRKHEYLENECGSAGRCPSRYRGDVAALGRYADIATVTGVLGAVGVATGVTLLALPPSRGIPRASATRLFLQPGAGVGFVLVASDLD
jgi:hypothetical protein